jgi:hypothetical protein
MKEPGGEKSSSGGIKYRSIQNQSHSCPGAPALSGPVLLPGPPHLGPCLLPTQPHTVLVPPPLYYQELGSSPQKAVPSVAFLLSLHSRQKWRKDRLKTSRGTDVTMETSGWGPSESLPHISHPVKISGSLNFGKGKGWSLAVV